MRLRRTGFTEYRRRMLNSKSELALDIERSGEDYVKLTVIDLAARKTSQEADTILSTIYVGVEEFIGAGYSLGQINLQES